MPTAARKAERRKKARVALFPRQVKVLDTTLRDGAQTPGVYWPMMTKLQMAKKIDKLGVDVIEAGSPFAFEEDIHLIQNLKRLCSFRAKICALARPRQSDIDKVLQSKADRVNIFVPCSRIQADAMGLHFIKTACDTLNAVRYARQQGLEVEITMMDAARADRRFLTRFAKLLEKNGAHILTLSDTVGSLGPEQTFKLFSDVKSVLKDETALSTHGHNDRGLATANLLAAVRAGASQAHVTVGGLGERAGNASLEELAIGAEDIAGVRTGIRKHLLAPTVKEIAKLGDIPLWVRQPIIGKGTMAHDSGIHLAAIAGFEPFDPRRVGGKRVLLYGRGVGKRAIELLAASRGIQLKEEEISRIVASIRKSGKAGTTLTEKQALTRIRRLTVTA